MLACCTVTCTRDNINIISLNMLIKVELNMLIKVGEYKGELSLLKDFC